MTDHEGVSLRRDDILRVLSGADEMAREHGDDLVTRHPNWLADIEFLSDDDCPVTYLPVLAVMLVARSIHNTEVLSVLDIQRRTSTRGYSASSIAGHLIRFATQIGIDLRTTSSQVMNNQPFTFKKRVLSDMAGDRSKAAYSRFYAAAQSIEPLDSATAMALLALTFHVRRGAATRAADHFVIAGDRRALDAIVAATAAFVAENSEAGKVGQAFAAALLDVLFPSQDVRMGNNNDPSAIVPGDVQVGSGGTFWLWAEVKQKAVVTSEIQTFVDRVKAIGGDRVMYFALGNAVYPQNIDVAQLQKRATKDGIELTVYVTPEQALDDLLPKSPGSASMQAEDVAGRMGNRLHEAQVTSALEQAWVALVQRSGGIDSARPHES